MFLSKKVFEKIVITNQTSRKELEFLIAVQFTLKRINEKQVSGLFQKFFIERIKILSRALDEDKKTAGHYFIGAMGSLGTGEMSFSSDADLIFITDNLREFPDQQNIFVDLLNKIREEFKPTSVDCRLRPEGKSAMLVWDVESYSNYILQRARTWELQAFTKLKFISGNKILFNKIVRSIIKRLRNEDRIKIKNDLLEMRKKLVTGSGSFPEIINLKKNRGGITDIEFILQYLILCSPELFRKFSASNPDKITKGSGDVKLISNLLNNYKFYKSLLLNNQNYFNQNSSVISLDKIKLNGLAVIMNYDSPEELKSKITSTLTETSLLFTKFFENIFMNILKKYFAVLTGIFVFIIYLTTLAPTILQIDAGELTTVQALAGIAHPTGYPLFTMIGYLFSKIPSPFSVAFQLNILAAIWCSLGVGLFTYTSKFILDNPDKFQFAKKTQVKKSQAKQKNQQKTTKGNLVLPESIKYAASIGGGLFLGLSKTFWFQSTSVEVYSMHIFLVSLIIFVLLKAFTSPETEKVFSLKNKWIILAIVLALGFSNHMTTLLILPGIAYFYFLKEKFNTASIRQIAIMLLIFFPLLIIIYSYLPLRALHNPPVNWGNPIDFERIMRHISGKQYQVWLFSSAEAAKKQLAYFINNLPTEYTFTLLISIAGIFVSFFRAKKLSLFLIITFISTVAYSINYDINDIDSYFLLAYIMLAYFSVFGIIKIYELITIKDYRIHLTIAVIILFFAGEVLINYKEVNQSNTYTFEDYTKALISSTDKNSIVFSYLWDYFVSASYYYQYVDGFRKDVAVVDKELLRRSWYFNQIETDHPDVISGMKTDIDLFKNALVPFERSEDYNANLLESLYRKMMTDLVATNIDKRSFYFPPEIAENELRNGEFKLPEGYSFVPDVLLYKVVKNSGDYIPAADPDFHIRFPEEGNHYTDFVQSLAGSVLASRALYELRFNKPDRARVYVDKIKKEFPKYMIPENLRNL